MVLWYIIPLSNEQMRLVPLLLIHEHLFLARMEYDAPLFNEHLMANHSAENVRHVTTSHVITRADDTPVVVVKLCYNIDLKNLLYRQWNCLQRRQYV